MDRLRLASVCLLTLLPAGVGRPDEPAARPRPAAAGSSDRLRAAPLSPDEFTEIVPLGNLNPPGHTFPTDHVYFYLVEPKKTHPVYAPAAGTVDWVLETGRDDDKVVVRVTPTFRYYLGHVALAPGIRRGTPVAEGQRLGTFSGRAYALDLGVVNDAVTRKGFVNPRRYPADTLHADSPLKHFREPLRATLYARVRRAGPDKDGQIDFDVPGRLVGNWFLDGLGERDSFQPGAWDKHLAFVRDVRDPAAVRIAVGGTLARAGVFAVPKDAPDPAEVSRRTGKVTYQLLDVRNGTPCGLLLVELVEDDCVRVEVVPGSPRGTPGFSDRARRYRR
jgi:hypothetical protein